jgi:hypothetical protein
MVGRTHHDMKPACPARNSLCCNIPSERLEAVHDPGTKVAQGKQSRNGTFETAVLEPDFLTMLNRTMHIIRTESGVGQELRGDAMVLGQARACVRTSSCFVGL